MFGWEGDREDQKFPRVGRWNVGWGPPGRVLWVWGPQFLTLAAAFFLGFPAAGLGAAVDLGSGFLGLAVFLVAVTLGCYGASVTWRGEGFGFGVE
jgi:hypothetical protein